MNGPWRGGIVVHGDTHFATVCEQGVRQPDHEIHVYRLSSTVIVTANKLLTAQRHVRADKTGQAGLQYYAVASAAATVLDTDERCNAITRNRGVVLQ